MRHTTLALVGVLALLVPATAFAATDDYLYVVTELKVSSDYRFTSPATTYRQHFSVTRRPPSRGGGVPGAKVLHAGSFGATLDLPESRPRLLIDATFTPPDGSAAERCHKGLTTNNPMDQRVKLTLRKRVLEGQLYLYPQGPAYGFCPFDVYTPTAVLGQLRTPLRIKLATLDHQRRVTVPFRLSRTGSGFGGQARITFSGTLKLRRESICDARIRCRH